MNTFIINIIYPIATYDDFGTRSYKTPYKNLSDMKPVFLEMYYKEAITA